MRKTMKMEYKKLMKEEKYFNLFLTSVLLRKQLLHINRIITGVVGLKRLDLRAGMHLAKVALLKIR